MSEVEVAALSTLSFKTEEFVTSFTGRFERVDVNRIFLFGGSSVAGAIVLLLIIIILWDHFSRSRDERLRTNIATVRSLSRIMRIESTGVGKGDDPQGLLNQLAIRDVTTCPCKEIHNDNCEVSRRYHMGSSKIGRPVHKGKDIGEVLNVLRKMTSKEETLREGRGEGVRSKEGELAKDQQESNDSPVMPGSQTVAAHEEADLSGPRLGPNDSHPFAC